MHKEYAMDATTNKAASELSSSDRQKPVHEIMNLSELEWCHEADRKKEVFAVSRDPETHFEIKVKSDITLEQYRNATPAPLWELMEQEVAPLKGKRGFILSSTFEGGGVAMQEPPLVNMLQQMDVDISWLVSDADDAAFEVTKKMHNLQQDVLAADVQFTTADKDAHKKYGLDNFRRMMEMVPGFATADFYWIEDPQLAAMIPELMKINPNATFIYRNHIQTDRDKMATEGSPQKEIYEYLRDECRVGDVDAYVAHPVEQFVPYGTPNVVAMPPTSDQFEDLNRPQTAAEKAEKHRWLDGQVVKQNLTRQEAIRKAHVLEHGTEPDEETLHKEDQPLFSRDRKWLTGFARFDRAKGQEFNMMLHALIADKLTALGRADLIPHTIIAGNGATDDPDRNTVLAELIELRRTKYAKYAEHITVVGLEHDYAAVNTLLTDSMYTENFSVAEGFEHRRTESMIKGVPSCSTNAGGLPLQGLDGEGGFVADLENMPEELERIANEIVQDLLDEARYQARRERTLEWAERFSTLELTTVANVTREARIINKKGDRRWKMSEFIAEKQERDARALGGKALEA
jgi:hypothetical protein